MHSEKIRLDILLLEQGLCQTRSRAQDLIKRGLVCVDGIPCKKPGTLVNTAVDLQISHEAEDDFVSRGGRKLLAALRYFNVKVEGSACLDAGISTGGFTECLLREGASLVVGVEVGQNQLAQGLQGHPQLKVFEKTNIKNVDLNFLEAHGFSSPDLIVCDLSFVSLSKVLSAFWKLQPKKRNLIALVKPQFEVGRERLGKNGIVKLEVDHIYALNKVTQCATELGYSRIKLMYSPLQGGEGNIEYLMHASDEAADAASTSVTAEILAVVKDAFHFFKAKPE